MTTPTTLEIARKFAEELVGNYDTARLILTLADQVEALTKERDDLKAIVAGKIKTIALYRVEMLKACKERDALAADAARYQWVKKQTRAFSLDMGGKHSWAVTGGFMRAKGSSLDEAIDAAIQEAGVQ